MTKESFPQELGKVTPEEIRTTCTSLRKLARDRTDRLPHEIRANVASVTFSSAHKGKPLGTEADIMEVTVKQISSPWILVELKDTIGARHIEYALNESGEMHQIGNFTPYSEKPSSELGDELVNNMGFYEPLLEAAACEISIKV